MALRCSVHDLPEGVLMRVRTVARVAVTILATLVGLVLLAPPAAEAACPSSLAGEAGGGPAREGAFRSQLTVDGVLAPGALGLPGEQITWVVTLANVGTAPGTDITLTNQVHDQLRIDSVEVDGGEFAISGQVVVFKPPALAPGEQVQMRLNTTLISTPPSGSVVNRVQLEAGGSDAAIEDSALAEVFVPTGLPATGYPPSSDLPRAGGPSVIAVALLGIAAVIAAAGYVWWRGSVRRV